MKKIFYILLVSISASISLASCTEEKVEPNYTVNPPSGGVSEPH